MASNATSTPTTPAMPTTMTADEPSRCLSVLMPTLATEAACRPRRVKTNHAVSNTASTMAPGQGSITQTPSTTTTRTSSRRFIRNRMGLPSSAAGESVDDVQAHGAPGRQRADQKADQRHQPETKQPAVGADHGQVQHAACLLY